MYRASQPGLSRPELYGNGIIIPNHPASVHMARTAQQLSAFPHRSIVWDEELGNVGPSAFPSDVVGASSLENSGRFRASLHCVSSYAPVECCVV
uniref:Uncharacterized protein n=1 Tax=Aegilops tauschii subsp. strangulata TaxID=200361 RepID=A0A453IKR4_AEGTS